MISKIMKVLEPFRTPIIILIVFGIIALGLTQGVPMIRDRQAASSPVTGITATNDKQYSSIDNIKEKDFSVKLVHENGEETSVSSDDIKINKKKALPIGATVPITVSYSGTEDNPLDKTLKCEVDVSIKREKIVEIQCGYPEVSDASAILYSNGELAFEGEGDIMIFDEGDAPWLDLDTDVEITSISFEDSVEPTDMNYWFKGLDTLTYCDAIPSSVITMMRTFSDCEGLKTMADWTNCTDLLNITECYNGCSKLVNTCTIPSSVRTAEGAFGDCSNLATTPDMSGSRSLTNATEMFIGCQGLVDVIMPPNLEIMDSMFADCINLKNMPEIPESVTSMSSAFNGDLSLTNLTQIPSNVTDVSSTFGECQLISGELIIDANCESFDNMFSGAALATNINLTGDSVMLDVYANTCDSGNARVNGNKPDSEITSYEDALEKKESSKKKS